MSQPVTPFLKQAGDFRNWNVYRKAVVICDVTEMFIRRELPRDSRTVDQMRQAARSCKQNIVEGVTDGAVSVEICIKLLGVAKGSLRELLEDYRDFLRQNKRTTWEHDDRRTISTRRFCKEHDDAALFVERCECRSAETVANIMVTQLCQLDYMLAKVIDRVQADFIAQGGIKERMSAVRRQHRGF